MSKDWLRTDRQERIAQNARFCAGILRYAAHLNLDLIEVAEVIRDLHWSTYYLNYESWLDAELQAAEVRTRIKHVNHSTPEPLPLNVLPSPPSGVFAGDLSIPLSPEPPAGIDSRFRALVRTLKSAAHYQTSIGAELDVLAPLPNAPDPATVRPRLKVQALTGGTIQFTVRPMKFNTVLFQCRVAGADSFLTIARSTTGKLKWNAPGPFPRELEVRARFAKDDQLVGVPCPVLPVTALG